LVDVSINVIEEVSAKLETKARCWRDDPHDLGWRPVGTYASAAALADIEHKEGVVFQVVT